MRVTHVMQASVALLVLAAILPAKNAIAQERLVVKVPPENAKYTQQHAIEVGDVSGHQVRLFEVHRTYPGNAPMIAGIKMVESWSRGITDYTNNNGEGTIYGVYVLENGDRFFTRGALVTTQASGEGSLTAMTVGPITGGTGKLSRINGMARTSTSANPTAGMTETRIEIEYWLPQ